MVRSEIVPLDGGRCKEEDEGFPDDGSGVATEIEEDVEAVDRLRARDSCGIARGRT